MRFRELQHAPQIFCQEIKLAMQQHTGSTSLRQTQCAPLDPKKWLGFTLGQSQCVAPENCGFPSQEIDLRPESWPAFSKKPGGPRLKVGLVFEPEIWAGFCARKLVGAYFKNKRRPFSGQVSEPEKRARFQARKTARCNRKMASLGQRNAARVVAATID